MAWPTPREYSLALNKVGKKLPGPGLAGCEFQNNPQGLPKPQVGGFGAVFEATTPDGRRWALKFFHKMAKNPPDAGLGFLRLARKGNPGPGQGIPHGPNAMD